MVALVIKWSSVTQATNHETLFCSQTLIWLQGPTQCKITISQALGNVQCSQLCCFVKKSYGSVQRVRLRIALALTIPMYASQKHSYLQTCHQSPMNLAVNKKGTSIKIWGEERLKGYWHISRHIQRRKDNSRIASYHHRLPFSASSSGAKVIYGRSLDRTRLCSVFRSNSMCLNIRRLKDYQIIRREDYLRIEMSKDYQGIKISDGHHSGWEDSKFIG